MKVLSGTTVRRMIPALAIGGVLAFSFLTQTPSLASSTNNCGVKGYGYHDHGKPCPNRPFPGQGKGILKLLSGAIATAEDTQAIATLHAESWRTTYRGAYSDEFLDGDVHANRMEVWGARLAAPERNQFVVVADDSASTEGTWGRNSSGAAGNGATPSGQRGFTSRSNAGTCP